MEAREWHPRNRVTSQIGGDGERAIEIEIWREEIERVESASRKLRIRSKQVWKKEEGKVWWCQCLQRLQISCRIRRLKTHGWKVGPRRPHQTIIESCAHSYSRPLSSSWSWSNRQKSARTLIEERALWGTAFIEEARWHKEAEWRNEEEIRYSSWRKEGKTLIRETCWEWLP